MKTALPPSEAVTVDLADPGFLQDPLPVFDQLREHAPVHWDERTACWLISRHEDAAAVLKDRERFGADLHQITGYTESRPFGAGSAIEATMEGGYLFKDRPDHTRLRRVTAARFTRPQVEREWATAIGRIVEDLLDSITPDQPVDLLRELAVALPQRVMAALFQLPQEDAEQLKQWAVDFGHALDPGPSAEQIALAESAADGMNRYFLEKANARYGQPGDDLISMVTAAHQQGSLRSDAEVVNQLTTIVVAGTETTSTLICGAFESLERHPGQWERLRGHPDLVGPAVEEFLRYVSPAALAGRVALTDVRLGGHTIRKGDAVQVVLMAANRDPDVFENPGALDIGRSPNPHLAFGGGIHTCVGSHLARLEARIVFAKASRRWKRVRVDLDGVRRLGRIGVWGYGDFPVTVESA
ncbi:cytochrome P450 [Streptomyces sp. NPDC090075]|uniref:cytochrome P450 n=1 Tax=Streptomyces sp. NPDC090075 TaxID=3365937 RepID=UPI00380D4D1B